MAIPVTPNLKITGRWNELKLRAAVAKALKDMDSYNKIVEILKLEFSNWLKIATIECEQKSVKKTLFRSGVTYTPFAKNPIEEIPQLYDMIKNLSKEEIIKCYREASRGYI